MRLPIYPPSFLCAALFPLLFSAIAPALLAVEKEPTPIFSRSQIKYGLGRNDYSNKWVDRPLFVDPKLSDPQKPHPSNINPDSFRKIQEIAVQYGLAGLGFFPENFNGIDKTYQIAEKNAVPGFHLLTDFTPIDQPEVKIRYAGEALRNPTSFRINGKVLIVSYLADHHPPKYWRELFDKIRAAHGDHFLFLPAVGRLAGESPLTWVERFDKGTITPSQEEAVKETLREWARATDGLYMESAAILKTAQRTFHTKFYREFIVRLMREVLAEPEFAGRKLLGLSGCMGHENATRFGYTLNSNGTESLRESLEVALEAKPDVIVIPEWDEQNENTSLRPTVYNARTAMRLLRHYTAQTRGVLQEPLPGDDTAVPNLIFSARKIVVLGEGLRVELVHVPEAGVETEGMTVVLELTNEEGRVVHATQPQSIPAGKLWEYSETLESENYAGNRTLLPRLRFRYANGEEKVFDGGFQPIDLRSSWNWDYKWAMQPLRDLLVPEKVEFRLDHSAPESARGWFARLIGSLRGRKPQTGAEPLTVHARFTAREPLAYVEILDNDDVIYSHEVGEEAMPRETAETAVFRIDWWTLQYLDVAQLLKGRITLRGAEGRWVLPPGMKQEGQAVRLDGMKGSIWMDRLLVSLPKADMDQASLLLEIEGLPTQELPLKQIYEKKIYGLPGEMGLNFVISRYLRQDHTPYHLDRQSVEFTTTVLPDLPRTRLVLQAVAKSGKVYRSKPILTGKATAQTRPVAVYSAGRSEPVTLSVDESLLPDIAYDFDPAGTGSVLKTAAGRPFWAILGGSTVQATGRGGAESNDGTSFLKPGDFPGRITNSLLIEQQHTGEGLDAAASAKVRSAPEWVETAPGRHALAFNGKSHFISLPQGVIPRLTGFELRMEVKPAHVKGTQLLVANRSYYPGSISLVLEEGRLKVRYLNAKTQELEVDSGQELSPGQWSDLRVIYDLQNVIVSVNGRTSAPLPLPGPGLYDTTSTVGGYGKEWYAGELRALRIIHGSGKPE